MIEFFKRYKVLSLIALVVVVGGIWLATKDGGTDGSKTSSSINKDVQSKCMSDANDELFRKFAGSFANVGDYKITANISSESGSSVLKVANDAKGNSAIVV